MTGWQPDRCTCGHASGDHKDKGPSWNTRPWERGVCLIGACECRRFELAPAHSVPLEREQT